jgi:alkylated DNA nucleotide flippase Atl1
MAPHRPTQEAGRTARFGRRGGQDADVDGTAARTEAGIERMLRVVEAIPAAQVLTYGDVAALSGYGGPRTAGQVMARHGAGVPWHRVVDASGRAPAAHRVRARRAWAEEGTPLRGPQPDPVVDLASARWDPSPDEIADLLVDVPWPDAGQEP